MNGIITGRKKSIKEKLTIKMDAKCESINNNLHHKTDEKWKQLYENWGVMLKTITDFQVPQPVPQWLLL